MADRIPPEALAAIEAMVELFEQRERRCPDGGRCWHDCGEGTCWRTVHAGPLGAGGEW